MNEPLDVRANAWIDAFAVFRKVNLDAWAVYNNAIAEAKAVRDKAIKVIAQTVYDEAHADYEQAEYLAAYKKANDRDEAETFYEETIAEAKNIFDKAVETVPVFIKALAVRDKAESEAKTDCDKAIDEAMATVVYHKACAEAMAVYERAMAEAIAMAVYEKAMETEPETSAYYDKACAEARAVYGEAVAVAVAICDKARAKAEAEADFEFRGEAIRHKACAVYRKTWDVYRKAEAEAKAIFDKALTETDAWAVYDKACAEA